MYSKTENMSNPQRQTGYGRIFCNYPRRRADYAINRGMNQYHFADMSRPSAPRQIDPRPATRNNGVLNSYREESPLTPGEGTPYGLENHIQDRQIPLNQDTIARPLEVSTRGAPSADLTSRRSVTPGLRVTVPNPSIPVYNHIIPYQYIQNVGKNPCTKHTFQSTEHVWSNSTRVAGVDERLANVQQRKWNRALKKTRPYPHVNVHMKGCQDK